MRTRTTPPTARIAYVRDGDIWVMNADGSARHQITSGGGSDEPAWSPDGQTIFFASTAHSADPEIYTISAGGAGTDAPAYSGVFDDAPAISPDGTQILVRSFDNNTPGDLWSIPVGTTAFTQLTSTGGEDEDRGDWSPDGTRIVYDSDANGNRDIFSIGWPSPGTRTPLAATSASEPNAPFSPDGSKRSCTSRARKHGHERQRRRQQDCCRVQQRIVGYATRLGRKWWWSREPWDRRPRHCRNGAVVAAAVSGEARLHIF